MGDRAGSHCSDVIREITKKVKEKKNYKKRKITKKNLIFFKISIFLKKTENNLTRRHFEAVGLA
jgi:hypothetical protein